MTGRERRSRKFDYNKDTRCTVHNTHTHKTRKKKSRGEEKKNNTTNINKIIITSGYAYGIYPFFLFLYNT